jgi:hypothetical protein
MPVARVIDLDCERPCSNAARIACGPTCRITCSSSPTSARSATCASSSGGSGTNKVAASESSVGMSWFAPSISPWICASVVSFSSRQISSICIVKISRLSNTSSTRSPMITRRGALSSITRRR